MKRILSFAICVLAICNITSLATAQQQQQQASYKFFDGNDWANIEKLSIAPQLKVMIKFLVLRAVYESTVFSGTPVVAVDRSVLNYIPDVDAFYKT